MKNRRSNFHLYIRFCLFLLLILSLTQLSAFAAYKISDDEVVIGRDDVNVSFVRNQIIIKLKKGVEVRNVSGIYSVSDGSSQSLPFGYKLLNVSGDVESACRTLIQDSNIISAEPNYIRKAQFEPNDELWIQQKNLLISNAIEGWNINTGSPDVIVAVIDTGVDYTHPDLAPNLLPGANFKEDGQDYLDDSGHGTAVCGVVAAVGNNTIGIAGSAWNVKILPIRACGGEELTASVADEAEGIYEAINRGADVINLSLGGFQSSNIERDAVHAAWDAGIVIVAAAGNQGLLGKFDNPEYSQFISYPAGYEWVCGVSSIDYPTNGDLDVVHLSDFSNYGDVVSVTAVGASVQTTAPTYDVENSIFLRDKKNYGKISGTSFSTPLVSGLAALIKSQFPEMTNAQIRERIEKSAIDIGEPGWDDEYGYGLVDFYRALIGGTHSENADFIIGVTSNPILTNDIAIIVKCKNSMNYKPTVYYWLITGEYAPKYSLGLLPLENNPNIFIGKLHTDFTGPIRFLVDGQSEDAWMADLEIEYHKN